MAKLFEILDGLGSHFSAGNRAASHDEAQLHIHIAANEMLSGRDDRLADDVREVRADYEIHRDARGKQAGAGNEAAAHSEEATEDSDHKSQDHQINWIDVLA